MEVHLDRSLLDRSIFPCINVLQSKTRREELLLEPDVLSKVLVLRRFLSQMGPAESMELLAEQLNKTNSNEELLEMMAQGGVGSGKSSRTKSKWSH